MKIGEVLAQTRRRVIFLRLGIRFFLERTPRPFDVRLCRTSKPPDSVREKKNRTSARSCVKTCDFWQFYQFLAIWDFSIGRFNRHQSLIEVPRNPKFSVIEAFLVRKVIAKNCVFRRRDGYPWSRQAIARQNLTSVKCPF